MLYAIEAFARLCRTLYRRQLRTKSYGKEFARTLFYSLVDFHSKKTRYRRFVTSLWNNASLQLDKQTTKNKQLMPFEQRVNPRPFFKKKKFVFWSKTFPTNDSLTPKRSNVQDNNDVTKQSLCSISSIKLNGHFGNVFVKPSAVFLLLTLSSLSRLRKKNLHKFLLKCFVNISSL